MLNHNKSELKAVMWGRYVHIDLKTQKRTTHDATLMELFEQALLPVKQQTFEQRAAFLKQEYVKKSVSN
jgi:acyl-CoA thioester hydrolase